MNDQERLQVFVAEVLQHHFSAAEIGNLAWGLGVNPDTVLLHPKTIQQFAEAIAAHFARCGRLDDLLATAVCLRGLVARKWAAATLTANFDQAQRNDLLQKLGINPEDVLLNPTTANEHAWAIVEYFTRRNCLWVLIKSIVLSLGPAPVSGILLA